ncbi:MAG TPA: hypothetical protein VLV83_00890 [Acidobacteriota bacterium]|nr:hypothetical protein [Acidobacteriota bacterium]
MTNRSKAILWIVGVFLAGSLFGGGVAALMHRPPPPPAEDVLLDPPGQDLPPEASQPGEDPQTGGPLDSPGDLGPRGPNHRPGEGRDRRHRPGMRGELRRLAQHLELNDQQYAQLGGILRQAQQRMQAMDREMRQRRAQIRRDIGASIRSMLTPEQKDKYDEYIHKLRERWRDGQDRFQGRPDDRRPDRDR